jgi:antitoxin component YwqK of YwqJK toxin-antitoxin module
VIDYHENGIIKVKEYFLNGIKHREDGPAEIWYYENGNISYEKYYLNDIPQKIEYYKNGNIK